MTNEKSSTFFFYVSDIMIDRTLVLCIQRGRKKNVKCFHRDTSQTRFKTALFTKMKHVISTFKIIKEEKKISQVKRMTNQQFQT